MVNVPRDPDFDAFGAAPASARSFLNQLPPPVALLVGVVGGFMALCTIGFFVLLAMLLKGNVSWVNGRASVNEAPAAAALPVSVPTAAAPAASAPPLTKADHVRGDPNAPLTLIEYFDFECPVCKDFHPIVLRLLDEFTDQVKLVYRHYPLSFHANAQKEAEASECAAELGGNTAFWNYVDKIFERTTSNGYGFALEQLAPLAKEIGLNEAKFRQCLDSGKYTAFVRQQMNEGAAAGVRGTPGSFLISQDGSAELIYGSVPYGQLQAAVQAKLQ